MCPPNAISAAAQSAPHSRTRASRRPRRSATFRDVVSVVVRAGHHRGGGDGEELEHHGDEPEDRGVGATARPPPPLSLTCSHRRCPPGSSAGPRAGAALEGAKAARETAPDTRADAHRTAQPKKGGLAWRFRVHGPSDLSLHGAPRLAYEEVSKLHPRDTPSVRPVVGHRHQRRQEDEGDAVWHRRF